MSKLVKTDESEQVIVSGYIYVIDKLRHLQTVKAGDRSWWCVEYSTKVGEHSAIYVKGNGIKVLFRTIEPAREGEAFCKGYDMATANIEIVASFDKPITVKELRDNAKLRELPALHRNFQRKSFRLPISLFGEMYRLRH